MNQLKEMLEAYRNGERGLPTYDELAAIADAHEPNHALLAALKAALPIMNMTANFVIAAIPVYEQMLEAVAKAEGAK